MDRTADIEGTQIKVLDGSVRPARIAHGDAGIPIADGQALPFVVERKWNAPAGNYPEQWFLIDPQTREILYEGREQRVLIWGLASWTEVTSRDEGGFRLQPGRYQIAFALARRLGAEIDVEAFETGTTTASDVA